MSETPVSSEELEDQSAEALPDREVMTVLGGLPQDPSLVAFTHLPPSGDS